MSTVNEALIKDVVTEVLGRLGGAPALSPSRSATPSPPAPTPPAANPGCGCPLPKGPTPAVSRGRFGVFADAAEACVAAQEAYLQLKEQGVEARRKIESIIKTLADTHAEAWGKLELEETNIGRLDHKIEKLKILKLVPGVEWLKPNAWSGDAGITHEEFTPFGVIGAVTPSTHSIPTLSGNVINIVAAGNAVVFNAHPGACRCAATAVRAYNQAIHREVGIENLICLIEQPTIASFKAICSHEFVRLLCITGGPAVAKAALQAGKRAICGGPGNPPVLVDKDCCLDKAASSVIKGGAYDNNLLCIGEKEVFVLDAVADQFMDAMDRNGGFRLNSGQVDQLTKEAFTFEAGQGGGCAEPHVNKAYIGKNPDVLAKAAGASLPSGTQLLFGETDANHPFVLEEQMMPFVPVVRVKTMAEGVEAAKKAEHGYRHTCIIHTNNVNHMTAMARALDTTLFVKNGPCMAGLGLGGEGYLSYTIATPTGEGVTNPRTFTRVRRCVLVDNLRIY